MPVNYLHSRLHRVEKGWDPIPTAYAKKYAAMAWSQARTAVVDRVEKELSGLRGKRILDLGGGPGQYSVLFAQRGGYVTWHDVSREYAAIARDRAQRASVSIDFSMGYLEDAKRFCKEPFDLVFCRVCWYYARSDRGFARLLYSLAKPGGVGYVTCNTPEFSQPRGVRKLQYWLNRRLWWKIGHPMPPHGRIASLFHKYPITRMTLDYSSDLEDVVLFVKAPSA
jgi:2-polyprenyl-3-methyl-5-hydroxy-6-metoxy-1,4-benzoquinol methylase